MAKGRMKDGPGDLMTERERRPSHHAFRGGAAWLHERQGDERTGDGDEANELEPQGPGAPVEERTQREQRRQNGAAEEEPALKGLRSKVTRKSP